MENTYVSLSQLDLPDSIFFCHRMFSYDLANMLHWQLYFFPGQFSVFLQRSGTLKKKKNLFHTIWDPPASCIFNFHLNSFTFLAYNWNDLHEHKIVSLYYTMTKILFKILNVVWLWTGLTMIYFLPSVIGWVSSFLHRTKICTLSHKWNFTRKNLSGKRNRGKVLFLPDVK